MPVPSGRSAHTSEALVYHAFLKEFLSRGRPSCWAIRKAVVCRKRLRVVSPRGVVLQFQSLPAVGGPRGHWHASSTCRSVATGESAVGSEAASGVLQETGAGNLRGVARCLACASRRCGREPIKRPGKQDSLGTRVLMRGRGFLLFAARAAREGVIEVLGPALHLRGRQPRTTGRSPRMEAWKRTASSLSRPSRRAKRDRVCCSPGKTLSRHPAPRSFLQMVTGARILTSR